MLKFYNYDIVFQEVPDEVSLAVNLTNCPNHCRQCHSPHLWEDVGTRLDEEELDAMIAEYGKGITCVCFMGGDAAPSEVKYFAEYVHEHYELKVAWYSGKNVLPEADGLFDYVKIGPYIPEKGGLKEPATNQRFYKLLKNTWEDQTKRFQKHLG